MDIAEFNALDAAAAVAVLESSAHIPWWAGSVARRRPYDTADELVAVADELASDWTPADVESALADHPLVGEQGGVRTDDPEIAARLRDGNRLYEKTFDRVFLIRAAGRDAAQILAELHRRLDNDPATELAETHEQLRQIAALRLVATVW